MAALPLTLFDLVVLAVVLLSALVGLVRGGVAEILGLASWVGAAVLAVLALPQLRPFVREAAGNELVADLVALVGGFVVAFLVLKLITAMVARAVASGPLGAADKLLGLAFGGARGVLLVCAAYLLASQFVRPEAQPAWVNGALLIGTVRDGADRLARLIPDPPEAPAEPSAPPRAATIPGRGALT